MGHNVIPPRSIVELVKTDRKTPRWTDKVGRRYRIGYYNPKQGLEDIWLVDDTGDYCETIDVEYLEKYFKVIKLSRERDYFGKSRPRLGKLRKRL